MSSIISINPSNYKSLGEIKVSSQKEVKEAVCNARLAQYEWNEIGLDMRIALLRKVFEDISTRREEIAKLEAEEMGMAFSEALLDFDASIGYVSWYFENAKKYLEDKNISEDKNEIHRIIREPLGVFASIVPWNFPLANPIWGFIQGLIAGNTVVFKHSEEVILFGKYLEGIINKYLPKGVFNEVYGSGIVGRQLVAQNINMIQFTGSTKVGKYLYRTAGKKFIKSIMELGGSAAAIVFADANLENAIEGICFNRLINCGQACDGLKRLIVHKSIKDNVIERLNKVFKSKIIGNALDPKTEIGPLVSKKQLDLLREQVDDAKLKGAVAICGGIDLEEKLGGAFYEPTILDKVALDMKVWNEEVFGPVLPVMTFNTDEEAIELANCTKYGLGGYIFSSDLDRAEKAAKKMQTGMISINFANYIQPWNPFGGYKMSGFGREHGEFGFHEFTQVKVIAIPK